MTVQQFKRELDKLSIPVTEETIRNWIKKGYIVGNNIALPILKRPIYEIPETELLKFKK
jgi:hypothetical protein